jgi:DNA polymerase II large subunit
MEPYFAELEQHMNIVHDLAQQARSKGLDPSRDVEVFIAKNMAERVVGLISIVSDRIKHTSLIQRIAELEQQFGAQDWRVALTISLETAQEKFCPFPTKREAIEIGIRVGIAP